MRNLTTARVLAVALVWATVTAVPTPGHAQYGSAQFRQSPLDRGRVDPFGRNPGLPGTGPLGHDPFAGLRNVPGLPPQVQRMMADQGPFVTDPMWPNDRITRAARPQWPGGITPGPMTHGRREDDSPPMSPAVGSFPLFRGPVNLPKVHLEPPKPFRVTPRVTVGGGGWLIGGLAAVAAAIGGLLKWLSGSKDRPTPPAAGSTAPPPAPAMIGVGADGRAGVLIRRGRPEVPRP